MINQDFGHVWKLLGTIIIPVALLLLAGIAFYGNKGTSFNLLAVMSIVGASIACIVCLKKPTRIVTTVACAAYVIMIVGMLIYGGTEAEFIAGEGYRKEERRDDEREEINQENRMGQHEDARRKLLRRAALRYDNKNLMYNFKHEEL